MNILAHRILIALPLFLIAGPLLAESSKEDATSRDSQENRLETRVISHVPVMEVSMENVTRQLEASRQRASWSIILATGLAVGGSYAITKGQFLAGYPQQSSIWTLVGVGLLASGGIAALVSLANILGVESYMKTLRKEKATQRTLTVSLLANARSAGIAIRW